jgi:hypothetical protein
MTPIDQKAWKEENWRKRIQWIYDRRKPKEECGGVTGYDGDEVLFLWADAELKRLREAVEWALSPDAYYLFGEHDQAIAFSKELRRRAGGEEQ